MSLTLKDFSAVAGSTNSIGYVTMNAKGGLEKAGNHLHLSSLNVTPSKTGAAEVRMELYNAIYSALGDRIDTERGQSFLKSVGRQLGLGGKASELASTPLDRRTVRALVKATEAELGAGGKAEKATAGGKELAAFLSGESDGAKVPSGVLVGLMEGVNTLQEEGVHDVWIAGEKPGESFHLQWAGHDEVTVDCGGGVKLTLSGQSLVKDSQLSLVGRKDLDQNQLKDILNVAERQFAGVRDLKALSGNSSPGIQFVRTLSEKALLAKFGDEGLTSNELRNVPPRMMHYLAKNVAEGWMLLVDVRDYIEIACADRFNAETTLEILDMYEKADNKDSVSYAEERKAAEAAKQAEEAKKSSLLGAVKAGLGAFGQKLSEIQNAKAAVQAMLADVVSDKRSFLADQHPEPGGRLQVTLRTHTKALAILLCNYKMVEDSLPDDAEGFVKPLVAAMKDLLGPDVTPFIFNMSKVQSLLDNRLAGDDVKARLATVEQEVDKAAAELCTRMQYKLNHSFAKVIGPSVETKENQNDRYDELIGRLFDDERFASAPLAERDALFGKIDGFVDAFAKVGWSEKALDHVLDDALANAADVKDASQRVDAVIMKYAKFREVAELHPKNFVAPESKVLKGVGDLVNHLNAPPEQKAVLFDKIADLACGFAAVKCAGACCDIIASYGAGCGENFEAFSGLVDSFTQQLQPLSDFVARVAKNGSEPHEQYASTIQTIIGNIRPEGTYTEGGLPQVIMHAVLPRIEDGLARLKDGKPAVDALSMIVNCMGAQDKEQLAKHKEALENSLKVVTDALAKPANLRPSADGRSGVQNLVDFLKANGMNADGLHPEVTKPNGNLKEIRREKSRELLKKLGGGSDMDKGYGLFMTKVMKEYMKSMSVSDQRAMLAAGIRFAKTDGTEIQQLGAFLKGAGPIMQKMLQGFASMDVDKDFLAALADMKSNLPDMADDVVKANLLDMVRRSKGQIAKIEMTKKLGAASVGQAFLCTVTKSNGEQQDVVVKMLRPEAEQRAEREKDLFIKVSKEVPGMEKTFAGQLEGILEELDFRKEAENTRAGAVYDKGGMGVKSMKLLDVIEPTKYTMVVEKAPGTTVDRLITDTEKKIETLTDAFFKQVPKKDGDGKEVLGADGKPVMERVVNADAFKKDGVRDMAGLSNACGKAILELSRLYEETLVQQKRLVALARKWTLEGIYNKGFYHGDLHAGNIMVDDRFERDANGKLLTERNGGLTVIDFGNATSLTEKQQSNVIRMMTAANTKDTNVFMKNFYALMSPEGQAKFKAEEKANHDLIHNIFNLGSEEDSTNRIFAALQQLQLKGYELPGPIFKFSQCSIRFQGTISQMNDLLDKIKTATLQFRNAVQLDFGLADKDLQAMDPHGKLLAGIFMSGDLKLGEDKCDFTVLQKKIDESLALLDPVQPKKKSKTNAVAEARPGQVLQSYFSDNTRAEKPNEVCEKLMAPLAGLKEAHLDLYGRLVECKRQVQVKYEAYLKTNASALEEIEKQKRAFNADSKKDLYAEHLLNKSILLRYDGIKQFLETADGNKFVNDMLRAYNGNILEGIEGRLVELRNQPDVPQIIIDIAQTNCLGAIDDTNCEDVTKAIAAMSKALDEEIKATKADVERVEQEKGDQLKVIDEQMKAMAKSWPGVQDAIKAFGTAYEEAQKTMLTDLKNQLAPICHKNKKGEIDARLVPTEELKTFGDAVGHVIADNLTSSMIKAGFGLTIEAGWKTLVRPQQTPTV